MPLLSPGISLIQQVDGSSTFDYGISTTTLSTTDGNMLVVLAGWDLSTQPTSAPMPAVYVTDSAGNKWEHAGTSSAGVTGSRSCAWVAASARPVTWISVSATTFVSSLAYKILEIGAAPYFFSLDVADANAAASAASLTVVPGTASTGDVGFAVLTTGTTGLAPATPAGWSALTPVTAGASSANPVEIFPFWDSAITAGSAVSTAWAVTRAAPLSGVTFAIKANPPAPVPANPNAPLVKVEAAFGFTPGDPSQSPPDWADITARCIGTQGSVYISSSMGRQYEEATPEAGELHIAIDNHDGAFTPLNADSPFYPNVVLGTPVRVTALWAGRWYYVGSGWVERWPQAWPDLPQWGMSEMVATDAYSLMNAVNIISALAGEMLIDAPYAFIPCSEQYTTQVGGINPVLIPADAQGLLAANISRTNQRTGFYVDGTGGVTADTGQSAGLLGSGDSGFGTGNISAAPTASASGPGMIYTDPNLPDPKSANGVTVEFWVIVGPQAVAASVQPVVFSAYGPAGNYSTANPSLQVKINNFTGGSTLAVTLADGSTVSAPFSVGSSAQQIVLALTSSSLNVYVNGSLAATSSLTAAQTTSWNAVSLGCPNFAYTNGSLTAGNFTAFDLAIFSYPLALQRILSHFVTGFSGQENVDALVRVAQVLSWANLPIPRAGQLLFGTPPVHDGVAQGPAYSVGGASAAQAVSQVVLNDLALAAAAPSGALVYWPRWALYNQVPAVVFGDSVNPGDGEVPYEPSLNWDYDNTYLANSVQVTQQVGPNTTITATTTDTGSQASYFARAPQQQTIETVSNLDAFAQSQWQAAKYAQPALRVAGGTVDAASNAAVAFPAILSLQQGQAAVATRRPVGGAEISETVLVQRIQHDIGPGKWTTGYQLSPYVPEDAVLQLDAAGFNIVGSNILS